MHELAVIGALLAGKSMTTADRRASFAYRTFELIIGSDKPLPWMPAVEGAGTPDVMVLWGHRPADSLLLLDERPWYCSEPSGQNGNPTLRVWRLEERFRFLYDDGAEFTVSADGRHIVAAWPETLLEEDAAVYLFGPVLGFALRLLGTVCLHAGAVRMSSKAVAIVGPGGAGKSTTCAALGMRGWEVLSDDVAALSRREGVFGVVPSWPHVRLWPASVEALFGSSEALPALVPGSSWDKRRYDLRADGGSHAREGRLPLGSIVLLAGRSDDVGAPSVMELPPARAVTALLANVYPYARIPREQLAHELEVVADVATAVQVFEVTPSADIRRLPELCELIEKLPKG